MLEFHDPRSPKASRPDDYSLSVDLSRQNSARIACLANGFPDSERFLQKIEEVLKEALPNAQILQLNKGNASISAPDELLDKMDGYHAAIAAYGH